MKQNVCKWNSVDSLKPGDGQLDRFVGWVEHTPGTDEEPIFHVALKSTFAGKDRNRHYRENMKATMNVDSEYAPDDFETMWRIAKKIEDAPECSMLVATTGSLDSND